MKIFGWLLIVIACMAMAILAICGVVVNYIWDKKYKAYWKLADRSSTLDAKADYLSKLTDKIASNRNKFADYNAVIMKRPDNSFDKNFQALLTLKDRLVEIKNMDKTSFVYQTAIEQITRQEQGEAHSMINDIYNCYILGSYPLLWDWICGIVFFFIMLIGLLGGLVLYAVYTE